MCRVKQREDSRERTALTLDRYEIWKGKEGLQMGKWGKLVLLLSTLASLLLSAAANGKWG